MANPQVPQPIAELLAHKKVVVCVGAGGVGKTTASAALGVAAARMGKRTLVLTVDPARRLANALGLQSFDEQVQRIPIEAFAAQGCLVTQPLDAAMLDVKKTFDRVVSRYARTPEGRDRILNHPFYQQASTALAGSQEYMAVERLYESATGGDYDLVVLDTPPSAHALDFLEAPDRLVDLFDSGAFRLLLKSRLRANPFKGGSMVMRGLSKFTGAEMFGHLLEFFVDLSETFDGFVQRARDAQGLLRGPDTAFVLVAACDDVSTDQALYLGEKLTEQQMLVGAFVVNRVTPFAPGPAHAGAELETDLETLLRDAGWHGTPGDARDPHRTAQAMAQIARQMGQLAQADRAHLQAVRNRLAGRIPVVPVPRSDEEPDTLAGLYRLSLSLAGQDAV
jgi:anion-transporting  ArsA/GET3 family ATPase